MSDGKPISELFKNAAKATSLSNKSVLVFDSNGNSERVSCDTLPKFNNEASGYAQGWIRIGRLLKNNGAALNAHIFCTSTWGSGTPYWPVIKLAVGTVALSDVNTRTSIRVAFDHTSEASSSLIDQIRLAQDDSNFYLDVHVKSGSNARNLTTMSFGFGFEPVKATEVAEIASGETILKTFDAINGGEIFGGG